MNNAPGTPGAFLFALFRMHEFISLCKFHVQTGKMEGIIAVYFIQRCVMKKNIRTIFILTILFLFARMPAFAAPHTAVVLGHYPVAADAPNPQQTARIFKAAKLFNEGKIDTIVVSGGFTFAHISEARMMRIALVTLGVPDAAIIEEERAATTIENGIFTNNIFEKRGWDKDVALISQGMHLERGVPIFQSHGFSVKSVSCPNATSSLKYDYPEASAPPEIAAAAKYIIVFEPYEGDSPFEVPNEELVRRLSAAAAAYRAGLADDVIVFSNWYTRGPIDPAEVMKIALVTLGVPPEHVTAEKHIHYGGLEWLRTKYAAEPSLLVLPADFDVKNTEPAWQIWRL